MQRWPQPAPSPNMLQSLWAFLYEALDTFQNPIRRKVRFIDHFVESAASTPAVIPIRDRAYSSATLLNSQSCISQRAWVVITVELARSPGETIFLR